MALGGSSDVGRAADQRVRLRERLTQFEGRATICALERFRRHAPSRSRSVEPAQKWGVAGASGGGGSKQTQRYVRGPIKVINDVTKCGKPVYVNVCATSIATAPPRNSRATAVTGALNGGPRKRTSLAELFAFLRERSRYEKYAHPIASDNGLSGRRGRRMSGSKGPSTKGPTSPSCLGPGA